MIDYDQLNRPQIISIEANAAGQRIDNYLLRCLNGVPKSHVYRLLRKGEVRINGGRKKPTYRLSENDQLRLPPMRVAQPSEVHVPIAAYERLWRTRLFENDDFVVLNKPSKLAVHGGSGLDFGVIEIIKAHHPEAKHWELVHRLDRETSGCLLLAKHREALNTLQDLFRARAIKKSYLALLQKTLPKQPLRMELKLGQMQRGGERMVIVDAQGKHAVTQFYSQAVYELPKKSEFASIKGKTTATLARVDIETGRMHQIRVHAQAAGYVLAGDEKYGDSVFNQQCKALGLKRLFLHAAQLRFEYAGQAYAFDMPLADELQAFLDTLNELNEP